MQIELRKRLSHGLQFGSSYVYGADDYRTTAVQENSIRIIQLVAHISW